jgi:hypothetical protein
MQYRYTRSVVQTVALFSAQAVGSKVHAQSLEGLNPEAEVDSFASSKGAVDMSTCVHRMQL